MVTRRATQQDIARKAGVGRSTVSLAVKGHPNISLDTRTRIKQVAESLDYSPDPMLSAQATYRHPIREQVFHGTHAWLVNTQPVYDWEQGPYYASYVAGALARATTDAYHLEKFAVNANGISRSRL